MFRRVHVADELLNSKHIGQIFVTAFPKNWHERSEVNDDLLTFPILDIYKVYSSENFCSVNCLFRFCRIYHLYTSSHVCKKRFLMIFQQECNKIRDICSVSM